MHKIDVRQAFNMQQLQGAVDRLEILIAEKTQRTCVGIATAFHDFSIAHAFGVRPLGQQKRECSGPFLRTEIFQRPTLKLNAAPNFVKLAAEGFKDRRLARAIRADQRQDMARLQADVDILEENPAAVAYSKFFSM